MNSDQALFVEQDDGVLVPRQPVQHRDDEYDPAAFDTLAKMQARHFWYRGRHRFLLHALKQVIRADASQRRHSLAAIDLGAGCGGWIEYLSSHAPGLFSELALADSSRDALAKAAAYVGPRVRRYQIDLLALPWEERWDVAFLLDVLEHVPEDVEALRQVRRTLRPGGCLLVTAPAIQSLWTYNDELARHVRRYSRRDLQRLAAASGFQLRWSRYFMFILSPLLILSRLKRPDLASMTQEDIRALQQRTHRTPARPVNMLLEFLFSLETPLGAWLPFPWGTSVLGVFQKDG